MANPGMPDPVPGGDDPFGIPPRPFPGERPLGSDEPSAPYEEPPPDGSGEPGIDPRQRPDDAPAPGPSI